MYQLDDDGRRLVERARQLAADVALPVAAEVDEQGRFPGEAVSALGDEGFLGLSLPAEAGGQSQPPRVFAAVVEEVAQACPSTAMIYVMHVSASQAIVASSLLGSRDGILRDMAAGKHLTTLAFSERGSRSKFWAPVSQLEEADGGYRTSAYKSWVTSANHANSYVSSARRPGAESPLDSTLYLVRSPSDGVRSGGAFRGLGLRGNDSVPVVFENVSISHDDLLSENGQGAPMMLEVVLPWFAVGTAAMAVGLCQAALNQTTEHITTVGFEDDGSKLRDLPNLRGRLAEMSLQTNQTRALLAFTAAAMEQPNETTPLLVLQSRLAALEAALSVTDLAMKTCGGAAFSKHLGVERLFRDARAGWVMAPTADHLREFIGRAVAGMPLF